MREVVITEDGEVIARFKQVPNEGKTGPALLWKDMQDGADEPYGTDSLIDEIVAVLM